ncbi:hypothetical protein E2C01_094514 [Portunus trituberculatus]|uniref:Uncharacterized protein n=1 Tax=Portunus trituberculatus TaxID=210409 RepID=A0A5B7K1V3_PORTR|nr:hypothetical protein [Portunus trituberculatus]
MADGDAKLPEISRNDSDCAYADKENEPVLPSDGEKKREERDESKGDGDYIKLSIGDQYMVRRSEDTWREYCPCPALPPPLTLLQCVHLAHTNPPPPLLGLPGS